MDYRGKQVIQTIMAVALAAPLLAWQHAGSASPAEVERGSRLYGAHCSACHGPEGNTVAGVDLRRGEFRRGSSDEELTRTILKGIPGTAMVASKLDPTELAAVIAYLRSMRGAAARQMGPGEPRRGKVVFEKAGCFDCHRIQGKGSRRAPDLSEIAAIRSAQDLERSIVDPSRPVPAQHRTVRAVTANGTVITGRRLNEDTFTVQILDEREQLVSLPKAGLREYSVVKPPPHSYRDKLSPQELADLVAYLSSLKK